MSEFGGVLAEVGIQVPEISAATVSNFLLIFIGGILLAGGLAYLIFKMLARKKFNLKIVLFKKLGGLVQEHARDLAKFERIGSAGDYWLVSNKFKKILPRPKLQMGKNLYWYFEREDGEWFNFVIQDIDKKMKEAKVYYVDEDMRLQRLGIQKNLRERLQKMGFWAKYGQTVMMAFFVLIVTVALVILFREMSGNWEQAGNAAKAITQMAQAVENMASRIGGGVKPV